MSASVHLDVRAMVETLERLPRELSQQELAPLIRASAEDLATDVRRAYANTKRTSRNPGTLASRVVVEPGRDELGLRAKVRSKAPHAHFYEYGTVARFTNQTGAARGSMPALPTFVPAAVRARERMIRAAKTVLRRLRIPGFTGTPEVRES